MKKWISIFFLLAVVAMSCNNSDEPNAQLNKETRAIDLYLKDFTEPVLYFPSIGARVIIYTFGENPPPHLGQTVVGPLRGGLFAETTIFTNDPLNTKLDDITPTGLQTVIANLPGGTVATAFIPSPSGYGKTGTSVIPPNSTLVYDINLQEIKRTSAEQTQFELDTAAIHNYLIEHEIVATKHSSGMWYTKVTDGTTSNQPKFYDYVNVHYSGKTMSNDIVIPDGDFSGYFFSLIDGWKVAVPLMTEGSKYDFYMPSILGYGAAGNGNIPGNSILIYTISLGAIGQ